MSEARRVSPAGSGAGGVAISLAVAAACFWIAYDGGGYALASRSELAIAVLWAIVLGLASGILPVVRPTAPSLIAGGFLAGLAGWTLASAGWAASAEASFAEFNRVALYLGVFTLAALAASAATVVRWSDGLALGISGIGAVALAARLVPQLVSQDDLEALLPTTHIRLSYPVNYWNGLAILVALAFPLLLRRVVSTGPLRWRGLAAAPLPMLGAAIYLASSRGGAAAAVLGCAVFVAATSPRRRAVSALAVAALGCAAAIAALRAAGDVVDPPPGGGDDAETFTIVLVSLSCAATGVLAAVLQGLDPRPSRAAWRLGAGAAAAVCLLALVFGHPVRRFEAFKAPPVAPAKDERDYVQSHLLSANGSGRWQFWGAAVDGFRAEPLHGRGAGSYESWWLRHGSLALFVRDAHSLYLETLAELGLVGLGLLLGALGTGLLAWLARLRRAGEEDRVTVAALGGVLVAYCAAAGIDWVWELPAVSVVGFACLGLLTGAAGRRRAVPQPRRRRRLAIAIPAILAGLALIASQTISLLRDTRIHDSQAHVRSGATAAALASAEAARNVEPWAASPYLQLALVREQAGGLRGAEAMILEAIARSREDWRLWLVAARIQTKRGEVVAARRSLRRARELNPRNPILRPKTRG